MNIKILEQEYWYGGSVYEAERMPFDRNSNTVIDFSLNQTPNQMMPILLSNCGRILWNKYGFKAEFHDGTIETDREVDFTEGKGDLKGAYRYAMKRYFPFHKISLHEKFFSAPVYNTWIELTFNQNQKDIIQYASDILKFGLPAGILMIDDGWSDYYGRWTFSRERFPDAEEMIEKLHKMGFLVMVWLCPYITPDTVSYRKARDEGYLIRNQDDTPLIIQWWNGYSAALDLSNQDAVLWLDNQLSELRKIGVDGFKFDAGDSIYYQADQKTKGNVSPDEMSHLWCVYGEKYELNEFRAAYRTGGMSLMQRLCDKPHSWENGGIKALIPDMLCQGISGMPFGCPDMIGGGEYLNFYANRESLCEELFVRHCEIACFMPVMQFSAAPWRCINKSNFDKILKSINVRTENIGYILEVVNQAVETGEPVIRYMEYVFPHQNMARITDQFMVGSSLLVAPVYEKGANGRSVVVPSGKWNYEGKEIIGNGEIQVFLSEPGIPIMLWRAEEERLCI